MSSLDAHVLGAKAPFEFQPKYGRKLGKIWETASGHEVVGSDGCEDSPLSAVPSRKYVGVASSNF